MRKPMNSACGIESETRVDGPLRCRDTVDTTVVDDHSMGGHAEPHLGTELLSGPEQSRVEVAARNL